VRSIEQKHKGDTERTKGPLTSGGEQIAFAEGRVFSSVEVLALRESYGDQPMLVEDLIFEDALVLLGGESGSGKSVLCTHLGMAVARGTEWLGRQVKQGPVLWCCYEESPLERGDIVSRYLDFGDLPFNVVWPGRAGCIDTEEGIALLRTWIHEYRPRLVVVDPLVAACKDVDFDSVGKGRGKLALLKALCTEERVAVLVVHHLNKNVASGHGHSRHAGSHQLVAAASSDWTMHAKQRGALRTVDVQCRGRMVGETTLLLVSESVTQFAIRVDGDVTEKRKGPLDAKRERRTAAILGCVRSAGSRVSAAELRRVCDLASSSQLRVYLNPLLENQSVERIRGKGAWFRPGPKMPPADDKG
jgi:hypothetical protein